MVYNIVLGTTVKGTYLQSISLIKEFFAISKSSSEILNIKSVNLPAGLEKNKSKALRSYTIYSSRNKR